MFKVFNKIIPFKGFKGLTMWPFLFIRKGATVTDTFERHEGTHAKQQFEMLCVGIVLTIILFLVGCGWWSLFGLPIFYYWYGIEYIVRLFQYQTFIAAYKNVAFEQEAYDHQNEIDYLDRRKPFAWVKYLK